MWEGLGFGSYPVKLCRFRSSTTVEVLSWKDQDFWTEMQNLARGKKLRMGCGEDLKHDMWCLVEVIFESGLDVCQERVTQKLELF